MAEIGGQTDLGEESLEIWNKYKLLQFAILFSYILILIPQLSLFYIIVIFVITIFLLIAILNFLKRCSKNL